MAELSENMEGDGYEGFEYVVLNDDVLTSVFNASKVLVEGNELERLAVLFQFSQFLEHCPGDTVNVMVPDICTNVVNWSERETMAAAEALYFVVGTRIPEHISREVVDAGLNVVKCTSSSSVFDAWGEIVSMMLPQVEHDAVKRVMVPVTLERARSTSVESRRLAARLVGTLSECLSVIELERLMLQPTVALCEDSDESVRAMIAQSLATLGTKLPLHVLEHFFLKRLTVMTRDASARVRAASTRALAMSAEANKALALKNESFSKLLLPVFLEKCVDASETAATDLRTVDDDTYLMLEIFAEVYGYFLVAMAPLFADEDTWTVSLNALRRMVTCNGPTVRHWCAFNVPAVAVTCGLTRPERIRGVMHALSTDTDVETRATLASGIHETARVLAGGELRDEVVLAVAELMLDQNPQVRNNVMQHFADILEVLSAREPAAKQLSEVFVNLDMLSQDSWRTQMVLAEQLKRSAHLLPQELLCEYVAPVLFQMARESTSLVRHTAITAVIQVLRYIPTTRRRDHILAHFVKEWARGKVYWTRLTYLDGVEVAYTVFSLELFTKLFLDEAMRMHLDSVPNVRLRLAKLLRVIGSSCRDEPIYKEALGTLLTDRDEEVKAAAALCMKSITLPAGGVNGAAGAAGSEGGTVGEANDITAENKRREAAEKAFYVTSNPTRDPADAGAATAAHGGERDAVKVAGDGKAAEADPTIAAAAAAGGAPSNGSKTSRPPSKRLSRQWMRRSANDVSAPAPAAGAATSSGSEAGRTSTKADKSDASLRARAATGAATAGTGRRLSQNRPQSAEEKVGRKPRKRSCCVIQ